MPIHFGVDVEKDLSHLLKVDLGPKLVRKYGTDVAFGGVFVLPDGNLDIFRNDTGVWYAGEQEGSTTILVRRGAGDFDGSEGLIQNALNKMKWCIRTGLPSAAAKYNQHRIRPGDFPYAGAGWHRDIFGGVSGLFEESDDWVRELISDEIAGILTEIVEPVLVRGADKDNREPGEKYLQSG